MAKICGLFLLLSMLMVSAASKLPTAQLESKVESRVDRENDFFSWSFVPGRLTSELNLLFNKKGLEPLATKFEYLAQQKLFKLDLQVQPELGAKFSRARLEQEFAQCRVKVPQSGETIAVFQAVSVACDLKRQNIYSLYLQVSPELYCQPIFEARSGQLKLCFCSNQIHDKILTTFASRQQLLC